MKEQTQATMEFLVTIQNNLPPTIPAEEKAELVAAERARAAELASRGAIQRLWRVVGRSQNVGIWRADSANELHAALMSLPMFPFLDITVTPLAQHPSDPGPQPMGDSIGSDD